MGDQDRCVEVVIDRFFTLGDQFIHIYRITGRSFHFVQCPDRCHQAFISLLGGFQGLVREIQRTPVVGLQDKETDGHRGIGLLEHIVFSRKELVQGDEIPQRFAHFLSLDSDHIVVHPIFHGFVSVGSRTFKCSKVALQDALLRRFAEISAKFCYQAKGSGKSGVIQVSHCGQEVLERTACEITKEGIHIRFFVGFPANGRTINSGELEKILFVYLPKCVEMSLYHRKVPERETEQVICLKEDQRVIREELKKRGLIAFVANGSILPRQSGNSDLPMKDAVPFQSPKSMEITIQLRHRGSITGMGIRKGITLIAGGGYHGKSTLLEALEKGVYDHIAGDGREFVITDDTAWKLRAEDGRKIIEAIEAKSQVLLIDEDTSATNFMVRDELMQRVIQKDKEPITPFLERARDLYEKAGISTILVVGSCGSYFYIADQIIQIDNYCPVDITEKTRKLLKEYKKPDCKAEGFALPSEKRSISFGSSVVRRKNYRGTGMVEEHEKLKVMGRESLMLGKEQLDLRYLEQLADREQTQTLGYLLKYAKEQYSGKTTDLTALMESLIRKLEKEGIGSVSGQKEIPAGMAMPRRQEIYACFNRF